MQFDLLGCVVAEAVLVRDHASPTLARVAPMEFLVAREVQEDVLRDGLVMSEV